MMDRPWAMNLGSIGMIMAHEMTHALDIQGSLYDFKGDLRNWWSESARKTFTDKSQCFVNQYNSYRFPEQNMTVNGSLTLGENIADNGGIREAYRALKAYQKQRSGQFERLPGKMDQFDEEQLFFISFANMWCSNNLPNAVKKTLESGAHPPESVRVDGSLANFDKFSDAFHCKPGSKMFRQPEERCILW
ncbi:unnamed protein product [Medioppia subpectinata]|uniref:Peptidase M13 C-terminal domain-containing protein n=1 Tax=Medioppia subpectinata TaxID=1979941 RepID=A0A7R9L6M3_9ACAR|nr:unnamed protein product [Medioppia subpectinata]CAG2116395.1 unnamed protein product [Medioppia subpectinata]